MVLHIGLDDTDSDGGMCTTFVASELVRELSKRYDIVGYPRLVRLNPNIPWKTRGNAALALSIGRGSGRRFPIAGVDGRQVLGFERGGPIELSDGLFELVEGIVEKNSVFEDPRTNPAFVIAPRRPPPSYYWSAVRGIVERATAKKAARSCGARFKTWKNGRGLVGALGAIAWRPGDRTYEILVYRDRKRWGTERTVNWENIRRMDATFRSTFNNYDYENRRPAIVPSSPCPILFGIRGDDVKELVPAMETVGSERKERWVLFRTNQGTDDHLVRRRIADLKPYESAIARGTVVGGPRTIPGGHVIITLEGGGHRIDAAAYEPSKKFRNVVRMLAPGDAVTVMGGVRKEPRTLNIEKLRIERLVQMRAKTANPMCRSCGKRMKSVGRNKGYRCVRCGARSSRPETKKVKRGLEPGYYEPPVCARRHLSKPLKRIVSG